MSRNERKERDRLQREKEILDAAESQLIEIGYDAMTMDDVSICLAGFSTAMMSTVRDGGNGFLSQFGITPERYVEQGMDDKSYKQTGIYDFPQKNRFCKRINFVMRPMMGIPGFRRMFLKNVLPEIAGSLRAIVKKAGGIPS